MISGYAQTNIQLYRQLAELGYPSTDVSRVHRGHSLAMKLFTGLFRGSGRPFLAHLVGTASVLASVRVPIEVVTAGLLHTWRPAVVSRRVLAKLSHALTWRRRKRAVLYPPGPAPVASP